MFNNGSCSKWHTERKNLKVGDICILRDEKAYRGDWRLAVVKEVYPDTKNCVRNVEIMVKPNQPKQEEGKESVPYKPVKPNYLKRHVSNLILLIPIDERNEIDEANTNSKNAEENSRSFPLSGGV